MADHPLANVVINNGGILSMSEATYRRRISAAVEAERERCAEVAREYGRVAETWPCGEDAAVGVESAREIAEAIEQRSAIEPAKENADAD